MNERSLRRARVLLHHCISEPHGCTTYCASVARCATSSQRPDPVDMPFLVSTEVQHALLNRIPVVALESTIITHGMPYPQNLSTALEVEAVVRENGAVPATIAVLDGVCCIGLNRSQLERLAREGRAVRKVSRRDLPYVLASKKNGATTVSATMLLAARAGIAVFVTGGIGGVHRDGESTMDVSADLTELGKTPVMVVCAGAKSVLDIPRTLEYLETQGVCVAAYGVEEFPAFFTPHSHCRAPCTVHSPVEAARLLHESQRIQLNSGVLLAVPIPTEDAAEGQEIEAVIQEALDQAKDEGVSGNEVTPFLLSYIHEKSGGRSLVANIKLVKNNARVGAQVARALVGLAAGSPADEEK